jgi:hypothetical protein
VKIPPAPFGKGGDILGLAKGGYIWGLAKGGYILAFAKRGDILRLFSDRMPERIACRQVSENSKTFPPFEKGGSGGISIVILVTQKMCHPESPRLASRVIPNPPASPPVSSRGGTTRDLQSGTQAEGGFKPEKTLAGIIAKL